MLTVGLSRQQQADLAWMDHMFALTGCSFVPAGTEVPAIRGFVRSPFNPLIHYSVMNAVRESGVLECSIPPTQRGIVLGSQFVDAVTEEATSTELLLKQRVSPILFPQSVPSAIIGYVAKELELHGPMSCIGATKLGTFSVLLQAADWLEELSASFVAIVMCDVPSRKAEQWIKDRLDSKGSDIAFGGGSVCVVMEKKETAALRNQPIQSVQSFYDRMNQPAETVFHGMAGGFQSEASYAHP
ncbi:hypothetical protein DFQ01_103446 [Paenibacillus cellulosilyticus]|uniref:Beta-ketoacyl synthase-like protein n=1 Tax=Paenibacillus cellulosilyticus TaxID=375489 RepID=A0A2V2YXS1_9BACL|nr:hypothetical protein [Paenibacillus cellulosilyticus]PWW06542.1 hypothetical protein DFQ01_103446 [Paenibacillus cellulosilyticus]QKS46122.1 hypothetical protein HUB94_18040 [Paenibacillus cellulosilyticus]